MNGSYGKSIQRSILTSSKFISGNNLQWYISKNYYKIKSIRDISDELEKYNRENRED